MENTKLGKYTIYYPNSNEYHTIKREIWGQNCYYFQTDSSKPYIIDIGAHIGLSVIYFKDMYPDSEIVAFEPQRESFEILKENIEVNNLESITLINKAVWKENGIKNFYTDNTDSNWYSNASFLEHSWNGKEKTQITKVETTTLDQYINKRVDCIKIDTEGSELTILKSLRKYFHQIDNLLVEYHPVKGTSINEIVTLLKPSFDIEIYEDGKQLKKPLDNTLLTVKATCK